MKYPIEIHDSAIDKFEQKIAEEQKSLAGYFLIDIQSRMKELNMSQSDMAFTLGKSRAYVSRLFKRGANLTIKSMVELAHSLDMELVICPLKLDYTWIPEKKTAKIEPLQIKASVSGWNEKPLKQFQIN